MIGKELSVLFEEAEDNGTMKGFSSNYVRIAHLYNSSLVNKFSEVNIINVDGDKCFGEIKETKNSIDLIAC